MLSKLYITNYALIDSLEIDFKRGLTIITGETGAGKSIIMGALSLILGDRADTAAIRNRDKKTIVEATLDIEGYNLKPLLQQHEIDDFGNELVVRREIAPNGRSRAFINDGLVQLSVLKDVMTRLVDIHSQHSNMLLSRPDFQLEVLDSMAGNSLLLNDYRTEYDRFRNLKHELEALKQESGRDRHDEDYLRFQLEQLEELELKADEDTELEAQQKRLANAGDIKESLWTASSALNGNESSILNQLSTVASEVESAERNLEEIAGMGERVRSAIIELSDIASTIDTVAGEVSDDPYELERVEQRLDTIYTIERKHGKSSVNDLIAYRDELAQRLSNIANSAERLEELTKAVDKQHEAAKAKAAELTLSRKDAAKRFIQSLLPVAQSLGMKNLCGEVCFSSTDVSPSGCDSVEYRFAFNKNQKPLPVKDTASGGEVSRLMLCIKALLARSMALPTIIFDEVDTGVSGEIAARIGKLMSDIAGHIQVIAITHLPQVAAHAQQHMRVYKTDSDNATTTSIEILDEKNHIAEIARMLSGNEVNDAALANAKALVGDSRTIIKN